MDIPDDGGGAATTAAGDADLDSSAPLSTPDHGLLVDRLHSRALVIKSRVRSRILSHLPAFSATFSAAARSVSAADIDALLGLLSPGAPPPPPSPSPPRRSTSPSAAPPSRPCPQCPPRSRPLPLSPPCRRRRPLPPPRQLHLRLRRLHRFRRRWIPNPRHQSFQGDAFIGSALVGFYINFSEVGDATKVFDGMSERDTVA